MNEEYKEKWLTALRSGKYQQGMKCMRPSINRYCCLGVLCDIVDPSKWDKNNNYTRTISKFIDVDLSRYLAMKLANMNDGGATFLEIADYIEKNL